MCARFYFAMETWSFCFNANNCRSATVPLRVCLNRERKGRVSPSEAYCCLRGSEATRFGGRMIPSSEGEEETAEGCCVAVEAVL